MSAQPQNPAEAGSGPADLPAPVDEAASPAVPAGDDVRVGPDESDEPQAGAAEPTD